MRGIFSFLIPITGQILLLKVQRMKLCAVHIYLVHCTFTFILVSAGVVDQDYRGNVRVVLFNFGTEDFKGELFIETLFGLFSTEISLAYQL